MNEGYISLLLIVISLILFASGWKDIILRGITHTSLLLFFVLWLAFMRMSFPWKGMMIYGVVPLLLLIVALTFFKVTGALLRYHLLSVGMLLGSVYFFMMETIHLFPSIILFSAEWTTASITGFLAAVLLRSPILQIAGMTLGLIIGEGLIIYLHKEQMAMVWGDEAFQDVWWLALYAARGSSLILQSILLGGKKAVLYTWENIRGRKK